MCMGGGGWICVGMQKTVSVPVLLTHDFMLVGKDKLSKSAADEKWDRIKVVCTQPYNKVTRLSPQCGWGALIMACLVWQDDIYT